MKKRRFSLLYLTIVVFLGICIALAGYKHHTTFKNNFKINVQNQLSLIADLKVGELEHWLLERRNDAETVFGNETFAKYVKRYLNNPNDMDSKREIKSWFKEFQTGFNYDAVTLIDPNLVVRLRVPEVVDHPLSNFTPNKFDSLQSGKLVFEDFYKNPLTKEVFLRILIPILNRHQLIGIVELRTDPKTYLYPLLKKWPIPSTTSEAILIGSEHNQAVYLSESRFQKNADLSVKISLSDTTQTAVRAVLGYQGFIEGTDYNGNEVVSFIKKVPHSPWYLIAQIHAEEIYAPLRNAFWLTITIAFGIFLIIVMGLRILWRFHITHFNLNKIKSAEALLESEERFSMLFDKAPLGYQSLDIHGNFLEINQTWLDAFGYTRQDVIGKWFGSFISPKYVDLFKEHYSVLQDTGKLHCELEIVHQNGTYRFIAFDAQTANDIEGHFKQTHCILSDITDQKKLELERTVLFEITQSIANTDHLFELMKLIHCSLGEVLYTENIFISLYDANTEQFTFPYFIDQFDPKPHPVAKRKSVTQYVFRTGRPLLMTPEVFEQLKEQGEVELVGSPSPSWIGVPLQTPTKTIGVMVLQHYEKVNVYSDHDVQFLNSIGGQIATAIDRLQAEENLVNERILLRAVIDNIPDSIYCKDIAGRKTLANHMELMYSGVHSEADILGKTDFDIYPAEIAEGFNVDDQIVMQEDRPVLNREEFILDAQGNKKWLLTSKLPMKDESGKIIGLLGIGHNITERKLAEETLKQNQERYSELYKLFRLLADNTDDFLWAKDINNKYIFTNKTMCNRLLMATDVDEPIGKMDIFFAKRERAAHPENSEWHTFGEICANTDTITLNEGKTMQFDEFGNVQGKFLFLDVHKSPIRDDQGKAIGVVGTGRDVTHQRKLEVEKNSALDLLNLSEINLRKLNAEKDLFFSIIAHDLKSPFNSFLGFTQILAEELPSLSTAQIQEIAVTMRKSATNLYQLLENLLQWSQIQQGAIPFSPKISRLWQLVNEGIEMVLVPAKNKKIDIENGISKEIEVFADTNMLQTIIRNLVSNAVKFTRQGGKVSVLAKAIEGQVIEIAIQDSGIGMNQSIMDHLFRLDVKTNRKGTDGEPSTGLGLFLCKEFIEKHGGRIWVESKEGEGSIFHFTVPNKIETEETVI